MWLFSHLPGFIQSEMRHRGMEQFINRAVNKFLLDPTANAIAVVVLLFMVGCLVVVILNFMKDEITLIDKIPGWVIPLLALAGIAVSTYLSFVELTQTEAFCGPVGDCNSVQQSKYAALFGILPIGLLGIFGYSLILITWLITVIGPKQVRPYSMFLSWILSFFGMLFSIYLTFLEPFVIGATCMWCITSAIIISLLLLATTGGAKALWTSQDV
jgi:uncharacterized membrane protein